MFSVSCWLQKQITSSWMTSSWPWSLCCLYRRKKSERRGNCWSLPPFLTANSAPALTARLNWGLVKKDHLTGRFKWRKKHFFIHIKYLKGNLKIKKPLVSILIDHFSSNFCRPNGLSVQLPVGLTHHFLETQAYHFQFLNTFFMDFFLRNFIEAMLGLTGI